MNRIHRLTAFLLAVLLFVALTACDSTTPMPSAPSYTTPTTATTTDAYTTTSSRFSISHFTTRSRSSAVRNTNRYTTTRRTTTTTKRTSVTAAAPQVNLFAGYSLPAYRTMYTKLSKNEQYIYNQLRACIINDTYVCVLKQVNYDTYIPLLERAAFALYADFPEFFWTSYTVNSRKLSSGSTGDLELSLWCNAYWNNVTNRRQHIEAVMNAANRIAADAKSRYSTTFERLRYIHDYITTNVTYDHTAADKLGSPNQTAQQQQTHSAYGALVNRMAICEGYAKAYKLIANLCGYTCEYVSGTAGGGEHAWNYITVDGKNYWVDVTWDDPDSNLSAAARWYTYFGVTTDRLTRTHTPSTKFFPLPACTATEYDFYYRTGSHFAKYDFTAVNKTARAQTAYGMCVNLRFDNENALQTAVNDLFVNGRSNQLNLGGKSVVRYHTDKTFCTLLLILQ